MVLSRNCTPLILALLLLAVSCGTGNGPAEDTEEPLVYIEYPEEGQYVSGLHNVRVGAANYELIYSVTLLVNSEPVDTLFSAPFIFDYDFGDGYDEDLVICALAVDIHGGNALSETVTVNPADHDYDFWPDGNGFLYCYADIETVFGELDSASWGDLQIEVEVKHGSNTTTRLSGVFHNAEFCSEEFLIDIDDSAREVDVTFKIWDHDSLTVEPVDYTPSAESSFESFTLQTDNLAISVEMNGWDDNVYGELDCRLDVLFGADDEWHYTRAWRAFRTDQESISLAGYDYEN